jgi:hypothetical protein
VLAHSAAPSFSSRARLRKLAIPRLGSPQLLLLQRRAARHKLWRLPPQGLRQCTGPCLMWAQGPQPWCSPLKIRFCHDASLTGK